jgi:signal transduction histidine kinase
LAPKNPLKQLTAAIGSKWLGYLPGYTALVPLWFVGSILSTPLTQGWWYLLVIVVANLCAFVACTGEFFLFRATLWRTRADRPVALWIVVFSGVILGMTKALTTALLSYAFVGNSLDGVWNRLISGAVIGVVALTVIPILFSQLEVYRGERELLIAELVRRDSAKALASRENIAASLTAPPRKAKKKKDSLEDFIARSKQRLELARLRPSLLPQILDEIREKDARAISHQIWQREHSRIPDFTVSNLIVMSLSTLNFVIAPVVVVFILIVGPIELTTYGIQQGTLLLLMHCAVIVVVLTVARRLPQQGLHQGIRVLLIATLLMTAAIAALATLVASPVSVAQNIQQGISLFLLLGSTILASSVMSMARKNIKQIHDDITALSPDLGSQALLKAQTSRENLELAQLLHSQVQNVLLSQSMRLKETLDAAPSSTDKTNVLNDTISEIDTYLSSLSTVSAGSQEATFSADAFSSWSAIVSINIFVEGDQTKLTRSEHVLLTGICSEGISNAVKHGLAQQIDIHLTFMSENLLLLTLDDDGVGVRQGSPGLGTMFFNSTPSLKWHLASSQKLGGALLTFEIERVIAKPLS